MKHVLLLCIIIFTLISCDKKIDQKNLFKLGEALNTSIQIGDTAVYKQMLIKEMDVETKAENIKMFNQIHQRFASAELIRIDTTSLSSFHKTIDLYYLLEDSSYFEISAVYKRDSLGNNAISRLILWDLNTLCSEYNNSLYNPNKFISTRKTDAIDIRSIDWITTNYNHEFRSAKVELQNNTKNNFNYIKFRLILKNQGVEFFNQIVEANKEIKSGDFVNVDIENLVNYPVNFFIIGDNITYETELVEVLPKPISDYCRTIENLKAIKH